MQQRLTFIITITIATITLTLWFNKKPTLPIKKRIANKQKQNKKQKTGSINIKGKLLHFQTPPGKHKGNWTNFRGSNHDNICTNTTQLANNWKKHQPKILWQIKLGEGHAGPAIYNGKVYILDYKEKKHADSLRCYSLDTGKELWNRSYKINIKRNHGISRTVPAVNAHYAVTLGPKCQVMCVDANNGNFLWGIDLVKEWNSKVPLWYAGQCPIIENNQAIIAPAGKALLIGIDCATGKIAWQTPNPNNWQMSHASIMPITINGKKLYIYTALEGIALISAEKIDRGKLLLTSTLWKHSVIAPSPLIMDNGYVMLTAGYGAGSILIQITENNNQYNIKKIYQKSKKEFACEQQTPIFYKNHLFTIMPNDAGILRRQFVCMNKKGEIIWNSGKENRFGLGPFIIADNKFYIINDNGTLTMIEASTKQFKILAKKQMLKGVDAWAPPAIVNGYLLMRDSKHLLCINISKQTN